jgi:transcription termination/antitermination protein NusG
MSDGSKETEFQKGEFVLVKEGPYAGFKGVVVEVRALQRLLHLEVSVFGLATKIEVRFAQVEQGAASFA